MNSTIMLENLFSSVTKSREGNFGAVCTVPSHHPSMKEPSQASKQSWGERQYPDSLSQLHPSLPPFHPSTEEAATVVWRTEGWDGPSRTQGCKA